MTVRYDLDAWAQARLSVRNANGGRGYERGNRTYDCPLCDDVTVGRARGWLNVEHGRAGCLNAGCPLAEQTVGAVELVRRVEGFVTWTEALVYLRREYPAAGEVASVGPPPPPAYTDWCRLPSGFVPLARSGVQYHERRGGQLADEVRAFAVRQWGVTAPTLARFGCGYVASGWHLHRLIIPVVMGGRLAGFQARAFRGQEPKYLTSRQGQPEDSKAECGRPAAAMLFNLDPVQEGDNVILVEGAGDAMRLAREFGGERNTGLPPIRATETTSGSPGGGADDRRFVPTALLGTSLTDEKAALLAAKAPRRVTVALDAEPEAQARARAHAEVLAAWGLDATVATWVGGKDAGAGGQLVLDERGGGLTAQVARRLGG